MSSIAREANCFSSSKILSLMRRSVEGSNRDTGGFLKGLSGPALSMRPGCEIERGARTAMLEDAHKYVLNVLRSPRFIRLNPRLICMKRMEWNWGRERTASTSLRPVNAAGIESIGLIPSPKQIRSTRKHSSEKEVTLDRIVARDAGNSSRNIFGKCKPRISRHVKRDKSTVRGHQCIQLETDIILTSPKATHTEAQTLMRRAVDGLEESLACFFSLVHVGVRVIGKIH